MSISIPSKWVVIGGLILVGAGFSVWDWRAWRQAEYGRYGQGAPEEANILPSLALDKWYQNKYVELRIAHPADWQVQETLKPLVDEYFSPTASYQPVVSFSTTGASLAITVRASAKNLPDELDQLTAALPPADKAREYINGDKANITILTWTNDGQVVQRAYSKHNNKLFLLESTTTTSAWPTYAKTFWAMYESLTLL